MVEGAERDDEDVGTSCSGGVEEESDDEADDDERSIEDDEDDADEDSDDNERAAEDDDDEADAEETAESLELSVVKSTVPVDLPPLPRVTTGFLRKPGITTLLREKKMQMEELMMKLHRRAGLYTCG